MLRILSRFGVERHGAPLVEFTLVTPLLLLLGLGMFEFGNALYGHHVISTGVHDAARYLARLDDPVGGQVAGKELAVMGQIAGITPRLSWWALGDVTVTTADVANPIDVNTGARTYRGPDPIKIVRVTATASYPGLGFLTFLGLGSALTFSVYHEERVIGD